jgi:hypothetical protein
VDHDLAVGLARNAYLARIVRCVPRAAPDEDQHGIGIHAGRDADAELQRASWRLGDAIVVRRGRHVAEPTGLAAREAGGQLPEVFPGGCGPSAPPPGR